MFAYYQTKPEDVKWQNRIEQNNIVFYNNQIKWRQKEAQKIKSPLRLRSP